jgi:hypothetical protein
MSLDPPQGESSLRTAKRGQQGWQRKIWVWTADDCALVLIDYQNEVFEVTRSETSADLVELHARLLAKTAKAFGMPIVRRPWESRTVSTDRPCPRSGRSLTVSSPSIGRR